MKEQEGRLKINVYSLAMSGQKLLKLSVRLQQKGS
jgi:hypothetical protein